MVMTGEYGSTRVKVCLNVYLTTTKLRCSDLGLNSKPLEGRPQEMLEIFSSLQVGLLQDLKGSRPQTKPSHQVS